MECQDAAGRGSREGIRRLQDACTPMSAPSSGGAVGQTDIQEKIERNGKPLAYIIRAALLPDKTTFLTPDDFKQQVGFVVYPKGGVIQRHVHLPLERHLVG